MADSITLTATQVNLKNKEGTDYNIILSGAAGALPTEGKIDNKVLATSGTAATPCWKSTATISVNSDTNSFLNVTKTKSNSSIGDYTVNQKFGLNYTWVNIDGSNLAIAPVCNGILACHATSLLQLQEQDLFKIPNELSTTGVDYNSNVFMTTYPVNANGVVVKDGTLEGTYVSGTGGSLYTKIDVSFNINVTGDAAVNNVKNQLLAYSGMPLGQFTRRSSYATNASNSLAFTVPFTDKINARDSAAVIDTAGSNYNASYFTDNTTIYPTLNSCFCIKGANDPKACTVQIFGNTNETAYRRMPEWTSSLPFNIAIKKPTAMICYMTCDKDKTYDSFRFIGSISLNVLTDLTYTYNNTTYYNKITSMY